MNDHEYLRSFMSEAASHPLLTSKKEKELAGIIRKGGKQKQTARTELMECNLKLVIKYANYYSKRSNVPIRDLIGAGAAGLATAVDRFNPDKFNTRFSTFAVPWIKQSIFRTLYEFGDFVHVPIHVANESMRYKRMKNEKSDLSEEKIRIEMDITHAGLRKIKQSQQPVFSLDQEVGKSNSEGDAAKVGDIIPDKKAIINHIKYP